MASRLEAFLKEHLQSVEVTLIESGGGVFEVKKDGTLIYSKKKTGRFPEHDEVLEAIRAA